MSPPQHAARASQDVTKVWPDRTLGRARDGSIASVAIKGCCSEVTGIMSRIGFVGAGKIAQALAKGFIAAGKATTSTQV